MNAFSVLKLVDHSLNSLISLCGLESLNTRTCHCARKTFSQGTIYGWDMSPTPSGRADRVSWVRWCSVSGDQLWQWTILHFCRWPKLTENMVITSLNHQVPHQKCHLDQFGSIWGKGYYLIFMHGGPPNKWCLMAIWGYTPFSDTRWVASLNRVVSQWVFHCAGVQLCGGPGPRGPSSQGHRKSQLTGADWKKKWKPGGWWGETRLNWFRLQSPGFAESMIWRIFPMGNPPSTDSHEDLIFGSQKWEDFCRLQWPMVHICLTSNVIVGGS